MLTPVQQQPCLAGMTPAGLFCNQKIVAAFAFGFGVGDPAGGFAAARPGFFGFRMKVLGRHSTLYRWRCFFGGASAGADTDAAGFLVVCGGDIVWRDIVLALGDRESVG